MARILVTGGAGFIASELAIRLAADPGNEVVVVDNLLHVMWQPLGPQVQLPEYNEQLVAVDEVLHRL